MAIITYFLGAGASKEALPVMKNFGTRFSAFLGLLFERSRAHPKSLELQKYINELLTELPNLASIDTWPWALSKRQVIGEYEAFKILLSYYFLFEQFKGGEHLLPGPINVIKPDVAKKRDVRYQRFLKDILPAKSMLIKDNVRIISWNYDLQLEINYAELFKLPIIEAYRRLKIFPTIENGKSDADKHAQIVKINGTAGICYDRQKAGTDPYHLLINHDTGFTEHDLTNCLNRVSSWLFNSHDNLESLIEYSWDKETEVNNARARAKQIIEETEILVIVGYSFPSDNKDIDKEILGNTGKIKEAFYNIPDSDYDICKENIERVCPDLLKVLEKKTWLTEFYTPFAL